MILAIMQPYFLPYIGYWQLLHAADTFLVLDDVSYINRGWINRNRILINGQPTWITVPLQGASQNREIRDIDLATDSKWRRKVLATVRSNYAGAPFQSDTIQVLEAILDSDCINLSEFLNNSLRLIADYIGLECNIQPTSSAYPRNGHSGSDRILQLCQQIGASHYVNAIGGEDLYSSKEFDVRKIQLSFIHTHFDKINLSIPHDQGPSLSIIDLLMYNSPEAVLGAIACYSLR
jgi:hypothetical protein